MSARLVLVVGALLALRGLAPAQGPAAGEPDLKAAFVFNFAKFVDWPATPGAPEMPFRLCTVGDDAVLAAMARATRGRRLHDRPVEVRGAVAPAEAAACTVLYVSEDDDAADRRAALAAVQGHDVLTVGEGPEFLREGGIIALHVEERRVRFSVSLAAAARARLRVSAHLLKLASRVLESPDSRAFPIRLAAR